MLGCAGPRSGRPSDPPRHRQRSGHLRCRHPATNPPWAWFVTDAEITAQQGHSLYLLSLTRPEFAPKAIEKLTTAASGYGAEYERSSAVILPPPHGPPYSRTRPWPPATRR